MQQKVNESKTLFNKSFDKHLWEIHPSIIPFLIPIDVLDNEILLQVTMAPVNHNKLNQSKATQIAHTIDSSKSGLWKQCLCPGQLK